MLLMLAQKLIYVILSNILLQFSQRHTTNFDCCEISGSGFFFFYCKHVLVSENLCFFLFVRQMPGSPASVSSICDRRDRHHEAGLRDLCIN